MNGAGKNSAARFAQRADENYYGVQRIMHRRQGAC